MNILKRCSSVGLCVAAILAGAGHALATETHLGPVTITRAAELKGSYDDNIFLVPGAPLSATPVGSAIASFTANIGFLADLKRTQLFAGYQVNLLQYDKFPTANNAVNQSATMWLTYGSGQQSSLSLDDQFVSTTDPASSELVERARRNQNDAIVTAEAGFGRNLFAGLDLRHQINYYLGAPLGRILNRTTIDVTPMIGMKPTEKTRLFAAYTYEHVAYAELPGQVKDNTGSIVQAVASGEFTKRLTGRVGAGFTIKTFEHSVTNLTDSKTLPAWNVALTYAAPEDITVGVMTSQATQESLYNRFDITMLDMVSVSKAFGKKVVLSAFGMLITDTYPDFAPGAVSTTKRKDATVQAGATLAWKPKTWLTVTAQYLHRARNSNLDAFDYTDNVTSVGVAAVY